MINATKNMHRLSVSFFFVLFVLFVVNRHAESAETASILFVNAGWRGLPHEDLLDDRYIADLKKRGYTVKRSGG